VFWRRVLREVFVKRDRRMSVLWSIGEDSDVGSVRSSGMVEGGTRELKLSIWGVTVRRTIPDQRAEVDLDFRSSRYYEGSPEELV
jgi:hypothetical protein